MKKSLTLIVLLFSVLLVVACDQKKEALALLPYGEKIFLELASTPETRERGLMDRKQLGENNGMLFLFPEPQMLSFWMKNTIIPLDLIYLDQNAFILDILTMTPCPTEEIQCPIYASTKPASYALELNAGQASALHLKAGNILQLQLPSDVQPR